MNLVILKQSQQQQQVRSDKCKETIKMNRLLLCAALILTVFSAKTLSVPVVAAAKTEDSQLKVVEESNNYKTDEFSWSYQLSDGREVRQNAFKKPLDDGREVLQVNGLYSYIGPDGVKYTVSYYADETGYHADVIVGDKPLFPEGEQHIDPKLLASLIG